MANWYVKQSTGDDSTGDGSSGNPYKTITKVDTVASALDHVYVAEDSPSGRSDTFTKKLFIHGCNTSWTVGAATPAIDGTGQTNCLVANDTACDGSLLEYLEFKNATGDGFDAVAGVVELGLFRCIAHDNGLSGFGPATTSTISNWMYLLCYAYDNGLSGIVLSAYCKAILCVAEGNGTYGIYGVTTASEAILCLTYDNATDGIGHSLRGVSVMNRCYGNAGSGGIVVGQSSTVVLNRCTDNDYGIAYGTADYWSMVAYNAVLGNTTDDLTPTADTIEVLEGNEESGDKGWRDTASDDYAVIPPAAIFNDPLDLPDSINQLFITAGYLPDYYGNSGAGRAHFIGQGN